MCGGWRKGKREKGMKGEQGVGEVVDRKETGV